MEQIMKRCVQCSGDGVCRPCKGCGRSGYFLEQPGPKAKRCPHCRGSGQCQGCRGSGRVLDRERSFFPSVFVFTSLTMPTSISCAAFTGAGWRRLPIPLRISERTHEAQRGWVRWRVQTHFRENGGKCPLFTGYAWRYARGRSVHFDPRGALSRTQLDRVPR